MVLFIFLCLEDFALDTPHRMALGNHENGPVSEPVTPFSREGYNIMETPVFTPFVEPSNSNVNAKTPLPGPPILNMANDISPSEIDNTVFETDNRNVSPNSRKAVKSLANQEVKSKLINGTSKGSNSPPELNSTENLNREVDVPDKRNKSISYSIPTEKSDLNKLGKLKCSDAYIDVVFDQHLNIGNIET